MRLSSIGLIGGALLISAVSAAPSFAGNPASISGSATFITPSGNTSTVSAENVLSSGFFFNSVGAALVPASLPGAATVTKASLATPAAATAYATAVATAGLGAVPAAATTALAAGTVGGAAIVLPQFTLQGFSIAAESLSVGSGAAASPISATSSFNLAAASVLTNSAAAVAGPLIATDGRTVTVAGNVTYASGNIDFISAIIKAGSGVNGLD